LMAARGMNFGNRSNKVRPVPVVAADAVGDDA